MSVDAFALSDSLSDSYLSAPVDFKLPEPANISAPVNAAPGYDWGKAIDAFAKPAFNAYIGVKTYQATNGGITKDGTLSKPQPTKPKESIFDNFKLDNTTLMIGVVLVLAVALIRTGR